MSGSQVVPSDESRGRAIAPARPLPANRDPYGEYGSFSAPFEASGDFAAELRKHLRTLNKRKWVVISVMLTFVTLGAVRTLMETPLYMSSVRLQIDRGVTKIVEGGNISPAEGWDLEFLKTQYELLQSRSMAERAASALRLGDDPDILKPRQFSIVSFVKGFLRGDTGQASLPGRRIDRERAAAGVILGNRSVHPVTGSRLVDIVYSDPDPQRAQRVVTALADAFIAANLDKRFEANAYAKTFLEDQTAHLKRSLAESEKELLEFAQKEQIVAGTDKASIAETNLASASGTLSVLITERTKNEQMWRQVDSADALSMPQMLTNGVIQGLRAQRNALVTEYQEKLETFKPEYPAMVQISNKIAETDRQLAAEINTIRNSLQASYEASKKQEEETRKRVEALKGDVLDLQKRSIQYNILKREVDTSRSLYEGLLQRQKEVDVAGGVGTNNIFIVDKAEVPGGPSTPNMSRALMFAFFLGLGAGLAAAYLLEQFDDTVRSMEEIERMTGLATLGVIPKVTGTQTAESELENPRSALSEAVRSLCTALQFTTDTGMPRTLVVTSSGPGEGKSLTSLAIARQFAAMGLKVLLVDADLRNPSLHKKLDCSHDTGLSNYLMGACAPPETFQTTETPHLAFMASGPLPPNAADLLGSSRLHSLMSVGLEVFDLIVIDGPPVMGLADAALLSNAASATVFVVGAGRARLGAVRGAVKRLQFGRGPVIGTVLNRFDAKAAGYGRAYEYGEGGSYRYGVGEPSPPPLPGGRQEPRLSHTERA
jgi:capsular exopolysaccharide synthesis family protein